MIAYNSTGLDNNIVREQAREALEADCITMEERTQIQGAYPNPFYTPNMYVRIGLFILTFIIAIFSLGLLALVVEPGGFSAGPLMILAGIGMYALLEYLIYDRKHFRSGVDDALRWMAGGLLLGGIMIINIHIGTTGLFFIVLVLSAWFCLRFADRVMGVIAFAALLGLLINLVMEIGKAGKMMAPFLAMAVSIVVYFGCVPLYSSEKFRHYRNCVACIKAASLAGFYLAGNYFVVREMSIVIFDLPRSAGGVVPMAWLIWMLTVFTPLFYVYACLRKKDRIFLWVGLASIAVAVFTIRKYYSVLPLEWAMSMGGMLLIIVSYMVTRYLRKAGRIHGFTHEQEGRRHIMESLHIEALVIAETFTPGTAGAQTGNDFKFGGGSGGGGGAGGDY